jgi:hypothetical protein
MKNFFLTLLLCLVSLTAWADGTPTIPATQSEVNAGVIHNKYVAPDTLKNWTGAGGSPTNGVTANQMTNALTSGSVASLFSTLGVTNSMSVTNGKYLNVWLPNGAFLRTNTASPFDWYFDNTNGLEKWGTNNVTALQFSKASGVMTIQSLAVLGYGGQSGKSNVVFYNFLGGSITNDWGAVVAGLGPNLVGIPAAGISTNGGANGQVLSVGSDGFMHFSNSVAGGSSFPLSGDVSGANHAINDVSQLGLTNNNLQAESFLKTGVIDATRGALILSMTAQTNGLAANSEFAANYFNGKYIGDASLLTNFPSTLSFSQLNVGTAWLTNVVVPTNSFAGTVVDFSISDSVTNLGGGLTFTAVANLTAGAVNTCIIRCFANGADRTIAFPASFHVSRGSTSVVTNGFETDFLFTCLPGVRTNVAQLDYP